MFAPCRRIPLKDTYACNRGKKKPQERFRSVYPVWFREFLWLAKESLNLLPQTFVLLHSSVLVADKTLTSCHVSYRL